MPYLILAYNESMVYNENIARMFSENADEQINTIETKSKRVFSDH